MPRGQRLQHQPPEDDISCIAIQVQGVALVEHHDAVLGREQLKHSVVQQQMQTSPHHGKMQVAHGAISIGNGR